jgi:hypothetical protein
MKKISPAQQKYLEEYEKYSHMIIEPGEYCLKKEPRFHYRVISVEGEKVRITRIGRESLEQVKTLHWCRKNLISYGI